MIRRRPVLVRGPTCARPRVTQLIVIKDALPPAAAVLMLRERSITSRSIGMAVSPGSMRSTLTTERLHGACDDAGQALLQGAWQWHAAPTAREWRQPSLGSSWPLRQKPMLGLEGPNARRLIGGIAPIEVTRRGFWQPSSMIWSRPIRRPRSRISNEAKTTGSTRGARVSELKREIFGPVLHFVRYRRDDLDGMISRINGTGYGLTMGLHTRIDETIARVVGAIHAGNIYVNRNMVGAVVGVQPFGGEGLSGTGPKAGGPLYLYRLLAEHPGDALACAIDSRDDAGSRPAPGLSAPLHALARWAEPAYGAVARAAESMARRARSGRSVTLRGPTGERNTYTLAPRSHVLCLADNDQDRLVQLAAVLAVGARAIWPLEAEALLQKLPAEVAGSVLLVRDWMAAEVALDSVLLHGAADEVERIQHQLARRDGPVVCVERMQPGDADVPLERLMIERALSINTAAAGGNASLMSIG